MASSAHVKEYRRWVEQAYEQSVVRHASSLATANEGRRLDLLAAAFQSLSDGYHMRGAVRIHQGDNQGWHDIQAGYLARSYCFQIAQNLQTGWLSLVKDNDDFTVEFIAHLGLARLLARSVDVQRLVDWLEPRYQLDALLGRSKAGRSILPTLFGGEPPISLDDLKTDRIACCRARASTPERVTEYAPYGILDIELASHCPAEAEFPYPSIDYEPTLDENLSLAIDMYYRWMG